ncbi:MAG TPA: hypothetical protein VME21_15310 [Steroidobacteraceae bacterium]|nr:hypothetical protein [Steroidobacteraceae bacterium]
MKTQHSWFVLTALAGALLLSNPALPARISARQMVSGTATTISAQSITIGGQQYMIRPGSPAAQQVASLTEGQTVEAVLDAPAGDSNAHVVAVHVLQAQQ